MESALLGQNGTTRVRLTLSFPVVNKLAHRQRQSPNTDLALHVQTLSASTAFSEYPKARKAETDFETPTHGTSLDGRRPLGNFHGQIGDVATHGPD